MRPSRQELLVTVLKPKLTAFSFGTPSLLAYLWDTNGLAYQDSARTTLAASGEVVGSWSERVAGSAHLAQTTAANRPLNRAVDGIEFVDSTDFLTTTIATIPATGFTIYTKIFPDTFAPAASIFADWGNMTMYTLQTSGRVQFARSGSGTIGTSGAGNPLIVSAWNTVGIRYNPTDGAWRIAVNAGTPDTGTQIRDTTGTALHVGSENGSSFPFDGKMKLLAIHMELHSNTVMDAAMAYHRNAA
jgi:hypothetical protein